MDKKQLTFQSEKLAVDFLRFKISELPDPEALVSEFSKYFTTHVFLNDAMVDSVSFQTTYTVSIRQVTEAKKSDDSIGTHIIFPGKSAAYCYELMKTRKVDWGLWKSVYPTLVLSRLDVCYDRPNQSTDSMTGQEFLMRCTSELKQPNRNITLEKNNSGWLLSIGHRQSPRYFRIYQKNAGLRFEYEMHTSALIDCYSWLMTDRLDELEESVSLQFSQNFAKLLPLQYSYTDWLAVHIRTIRKQRDSLSNWNSEDLQPNRISDSKTFITFLQFLNYIQNRDFKVENEELGGISYRRVRFDVRDFMSFQNPEGKLASSYQLQKTRSMLEDFQQIAVTSVTSRSFQRLVVIPQIRLEQCPRSNRWIATSYVLEDLLCYQYPFSIPDFFRGKLSKDQIAVRVKFLQVFCAESVQKHFDIEGFLQSYPSVISNQRISQIKKEFIGLVDLFQEHGYIEDTYDIISDKGVDTTDQLSSRLISKDFIFYEKLTF